MAEIIGCIATTHGPQLHTTPEHWLLRVEADKTMDHWYKDGRYSFDELVGLRKDEGLAEKSSEAAMWANHKRCVDAMETLASLWEDWAPDCAVILGNDQHEIYGHDLMPPFMIYYGESINHYPASEEGLSRLPPGIREAERGHSPEDFRTYPALPGLAKHIIGHLSETGFDVTVSPQLPTHNPRNNGISHAFGHIYRQVMKDNVIPNLPIYQNTFLPPNQPPARRSYDFGLQVGEAIRSWDSDMKVVVFGSGGMSHFCIDEAWDKKFMDAMVCGDIAYLKSIPLDELQAGNSEMKTWISLAAVMEPMNMAFHEIDYVPCYRSLAGTGTAQGFYYWTPAE